jgi:hypothetical protein
MGVLSSVRRVEAREAAVPMGARGAREVEPKSTVRG